MTLPVHPLALLLPSMPAAEYEELVESIRQRGLQEPIWTLDGKTLDGRHRDRACDEAAVTPRYREYNGPSPAAFVLDANIHRRHLDPGQRAAIALEFLPELEREAKRRQGKRTDLKPSGARAQKSRPRDEAAALTGASPRGVQAAKRVQKHAPELLPEVKAGTRSLRSAEKEALTRQEAPLVSAAARDLRVRRATARKKATAVYRAVAELNGARKDVADALIHDPEGKHVDSIERAVESLARLRDAIQPQSLRRVK